MLGVAIACSGRPVELGATRAVDLTGGGANDAGGAGGEAGTSATGGSGGSEVLDAGSDAELDAGVDSAPPMCTPFPLGGGLTPVACELPLPPWAFLSNPLVFLGINLLYRSPLGDERTLGYVRGADCELVVDGYYLVDPWDPAKFVLCPETCSALLADGGQFFIAGGCLLSFAAPR
jgi:hypothetical protein